MGNLVFQATLGGQVNLVGPNTASTFNLNVPAVSSTIATLTGTETFTNKTLTTPVISSLSSASATALTLQSAGTTAITVDTSQNVLVGTTTTTNNIRNGEKLAVVTTGSGTQGGASLTTYSGTGAGSGVILDIQRSRGTTDGSMTAVASGDTLGYLLFRGSDGTSFQDSSYITGQVDGAVSGGTVPGRLAFITSGTERMRIDSSGNVGIGTTAPPTRLGVQLSSATTYTTSTRTNNGIQIYNSSGTTNGYTGIEFVGEPTSGNGGIAGIGSVVTGSGSAILVFGTRDSATYSEKMRIDSSGNLLVGTTNSNSNTFKFKVQAATDVCVGLASATAISGALTFNFINDANSANVPVDFRCSGFYISNGLATGAGTNAVKFNTTTKQLTYDTSSARYKNNIRDSIYGLDHVMQMRSAQFEYKDTGNSDVGLIAEEMQPIIPELVGLNEEGLADSVSYDRMVSVLVKAIQELKAINDTQAATINALTARVVALEAK